jgi:hypothetical protein
MVVCAWKKKKKLSGGGKPQEKESDNISNMGIISKTRFFTFFLLGRKNLLRL